MATVSTKDTILEVAARLFASQGYAAVSMRDVATEVGVTPANLYYHFKDKETLIREALAHVFADRTAPLEAIAGDSSPPDRTFEVVVGWFVRLIFEDAVFSRLLFRELLDGDGQRLEYLSKTVFERPFALITEVTSAYATRSDPVLSAVSVIGMIFGHFQLSRVLPHLPGGRVEHTNTDAVTRHVLALLRGALNGGPDGEPNVEAAP